MQSGSSRSAPTPLVPAHENNGHSSVVDDRRLMRPSARPAGDGGRGHAGVNVGPGFRLHGFAPKSAVEAQHCAALAPGRRRDRGGKEQGHMAGRELTRPARSGAQEGCGDTLPGGRSLHPCAAPGAAPLSRLWRLAATTRHGRQPMPLTSSVRINGCPRRPRPNGARGALAPAGMPCETFWSREIQLACP